MEQVGLCRCHSYTKEEVERAFYQGVALLGADNFLPGKGQTVFLKTNLLMRKSPESAVITHPAVVEAVASYFKSRGARVIIGDSPGGPFLPAMLKAIYQTAGLVEVAERTGSQLNYDVSVVDVPSVCKDRSPFFPMVKAMVEADAIISLAKLKTHSMMMYSGAAKNMFGVIPGMAKVDYHLRLPEYDDFANVLVDICETAKPVFSVIDGIVAMEGNGPSGGMPREVGALIMGQNPYAVDLVGSAVLGMEADAIPLLQAAIERGLVSLPEQIAVQGESIAAMKVENLKLPASRPIHFYNTKLPRFLSDWLDKRLKPNVQIEKPTCIGCGKCANHCPPHAMTMIQYGNKKIPRIDEKTCICCFCCQELCPENAIKISRGFLGKFLLERKK